jgi:arylsulfatase A-like enzyme
MVRAQTCYVTSCARLLSLASACVLASLACNQPHTTSERSIQAREPNVLLLVLDTLRADRLHAVRDGVDVMPQLRELASQSVAFTHATSPSSWTKPAMASLFTGLYPDAHHVMFSADPASPERATADVLSSELETLAEFLSKAGYQTAAIQTNANLIEEFGFRQGFDVFEFYPGAAAGDITKRAIEMSMEMTGPYLLYVHYMDPHMPYTPPAEYRELFGKPPALTEADAIAFDNIMRYLVDYIDWKVGLKTERAYEELSIAGKQEFQTLYDAAVRYLDEELAKLTEHIRTSFPNTLIVILSDHGEHFWEHGLMGHGLTLYNEELRVPLLISGPRIAPSVVQTPVNTINILPTIAAYLDLPASPQWQATQDLLRNPEATPVFSRTLGSYPSLGVDASAVEIYPHKLIQNERRPAELYDLGTDPVEQSNVITASPDEAQALKQLLEHHAHETRARGEQFLPPPKAMLDQQMIDILTGQGYFGDGGEEIPE